MNAADDAILKHIHLVLENEAQAITALIALTRTQESSIHQAIKLILDRCNTRSSGRLILSGVGKAGIIAHKISATFASTGTPSLFMHPTEGRHGDLGMVQEQDVVLALSNSGSSEELISILPAIKRIGASLIALSGKPDSPLAEHADVCLNIGSISEACPLGLAPSTSTTAMLALGDALALSILKLRAFKAEDYARYHPGGALGRQLMTCSEAMRQVDHIAVVSAETPINDALQQITRRRCGSALIVDADQKLRGIFTDGDLRRALADSDDAGAVLQQPLREHATMPCKSITGSELLQSALHLCNEYKINELPVTDEEQRITGMLDLQDLANRGFSI